MKGKEFASVVIGVAIIKCKQAGRLAGRHAACPKSNENWKISNFQKALVRVCVCVCVPVSCEEVENGRHFDRLFWRCFWHISLVCQAHTHTRKYTHYWTHTHTQCNLQRGPATFCGINWRRGFYHKAISYYVDALYAFPALVSPCCCCCCQSFMAPALYHKATKAFALRPDQTRPTAQS